LIHRRDAENAEKRDALALRTLRTLRTLRLCGEFIYSSKAVPFLPGKARGSRSIRWYRLAGRPQAGSYADRLGW